MATAYDNHFYDDQAAGSFASSGVYVPFILELTRARSVVDVGCGLGTWLKTYSESGVSEILGIDGAWVEPSRLYIPQSKFRSVDLLQPPAPERRFDVAQSLEVAEHLPPSHAPMFVEFLTRLSDVVVFSAASPYQGGTGHINERWPSYWRTHFESFGYALYDVFRPRFWSNEKVMWWYAQNTFLYVNRRAQLKLEQPEGFVYPEHIVHPRRIDPAFNGKLGLRDLLRAAPSALSSTMRRHIPRQLTSLF
ncbi:MAG TPA: methyltransferase domain-containing protein [Polyangiales bacterium]|nr:methyltransferase domain-containing protein [Polyangiales bacterium]